MAELGRVSAQRVDELRALAHQQLAHRQQHRLRLLVRRLDRDLAHLRPRRGFADRLGIVAIVLAALDEGFDVLRRDQPHRVAEPGQHTSPMMRATAGLQHHLHRWTAREEWHHVVAAQISSQHRPPVGIRAMQGEDGLGRVDRNACNLVHGRLLFTLTANLGTRCRGAVHPNG